MSYSRLSESDLTPKSSLSKETIIAQVLDERIQELDREYNIAELNGDMPKMLGISKSKTLLITIKTEASVRWVKQPLPF